MISKCDPLPAEIWVHLDEPPHGAAENLLRRHANVQVLQSAVSQGPGGARNLLMKASSHDWVVNFDDDARPVCPKFFQKVWSAIADFHEAAVITYSNQPSDWNPPDARIVAIHSGYACVFNRGWFLRLGGFVPLSFAYCMEEVDYGMRVHAAGGWIIHLPTIHVAHDMVERPVERGFQVHALANTALLFFLRYPLILWPLAALQLLRRLHWLTRICLGAIPLGIVRAPFHIWSHRHFRKTLPASRVLSFLRLQRSSIPVCRSHTPLDPAN